MQIHKTLLPFLFLAALGFPLLAEPVAPLFFGDAPAFTDEWTGFPSFSAWTGGDHVSNQQDSPWFGHNLESGADLVLLSGSFLSLRLGVTETFQFRANPENEWWLWARSLLTNIWLMTDWRPGSLIPGNPLVVSAGMRHDCKHDIETSHGRLAVHDTLGLYVYQSLGRLDLTPDLHAGMDLRIGGEAFLGQVFQSLEPEPYDAKLVMEIKLLPLVWDLPPEGNSLGLFVEGRLALLHARADTLVVIAEAWYADGRISSGIDWTSGIGRMRLWAYGDYCTDWWLSNAPVPALTCGFGLAFIFNSSQIQ